MAALVVVLLVTACSRERATPRPSTSTTFGRNLDSVDGQAGTIRLLHVYVASPGERGTTHIAGAGAELFLTLANDGDAPDALPGASSDVAGQVLFRDGTPSPRRCCRSRCCRVGCLRSAWTPARTWSLWN